MSYPDRVTAESDWPYLSACGVMAVPVVGDATNCDERRPDFCSLIQG